MNVRYKEAYFFILKLTDDIPSDKDLTVIDLLFFTCATNETTLSKKNNHFSKNRDPGKFLQGGGYTPSFSNKDPSPNSIE